MSWNIFYLCTSSPPPPLPLPPPDTLTQTHTKDERRIKNKNKSWIYIQQHLDICYVSIGAQICHVLEYIRIKYYYMTGSYIKVDFTLNGRFCGRVYFFPLFYRSIQILLSVLLWFYCWTKNCSKPELKFSETKWKWKINANEMYILKLNFQNSIDTLKIYWF